MAQHVTLATACTVWNGQTVFLCPDDSSDVQRVFPTAPLFRTRRVRACDLCAARRKAVRS